MKANENKLPGLAAFQDYAITDSARYVMGGVVTKSEGGGVKKLPDGTTMRSCYDAIASNGTVFVENDNQTLDETIKIHGLEFTGITP